MAFIDCFGNETVVVGPIYTPIIHKYTKTVDFKYKCAKDNYDYNSWCHTSLSYVNWKCRKEKRYFFSILLLLLFLPFILSFCFFEMISQSFFLVRIHYYSLFSCHNWISYYASFFSQYVSSSFLNVAHWWLASILIGFFFILLSRSRWNRKSLYYKNSSSLFFYFYFLLKKNVYAYAVDSRHLHPVDSFILWTDASQ